MKILLLGKTGQIGQALQHTLHTVNTMPVQIIAPDRGQFDLANCEQMRAVIHAIRPQVIINAAAYTNVDAAEANRGAAIQINTNAVDVIARAARQCNAALIHYSTDYVFDGQKQLPYTEQDHPRPINVYGHTKLAGEAAISSSGVPHLIFRTSWIYGNHGQNFLRTIKNLAGKRRQLHVVADQIGAPTWSQTIASHTLHALKCLSAKQSESISGGSCGKFDLDKWQTFAGIYHLTAQGHTSWYEFAQSIVARGPFAERVSVVPILSSERVTAASRPKNSQLSCQRFIRDFGALPEWETALDDCFEENKVCIN